MKINNWIEFGKQEAVCGRHVWSVARLITLAKDLPVFEAHIDSMNVSNFYDRIRLREMVMHMQAVLNADLEFPIILDEDGEIMDGRHRLMKAMLAGAATIKAVRFDKNPEPDRVLE